MNLGYRIGPVLAPDEAPWPIGWESDPRIDDGHAHDWERVTVHLRHEARNPFVIRCATCHAPRCGHSLDRDPCMERRHHDGLHITLLGRFEPVGGYLRDES